MQNKEILELISKGETTFVQFKQDIKNTTSIAQEMVAFSNSEGGKLLIGVDDKTGKLTGLSFEDIQRINNLLTTAANEHVKSPITIQTETFDIDGKKMIIATIPQGLDKPYMDKDGVIFISCNYHTNHINHSLNQLYKKMQSTYHNPVMLSECIEALDIKENGIYVDLTFGGGGHSRAILEKLEKLNKEGNTTAKLYAFDQDADAQAEAQQLSKEFNTLENPSRFVFIKANFRYLAKYLRMYKVEKVDGILADLGISSHQIDEPTRGFSTRFEADLDMRMDTSMPQTAKDILNNYGESELHKLFGIYGEIKNAKTLAKTIVASRINKTIETTTEFKTILERLAPKRQEFKYYAQAFQALRIEVNQEMESLEDMLLQCADVLKTDGRLVAMSYHSLEDRPLKKIIQMGKFHGEIEKDFYGNILKPFEAINRKPITPSKEEIERNPRARSAKLRIAKKL